MEIKKENIVVILIILKIYILCVIYFDMYKSLSLYDSNYITQSLDIQIRKLYFFEYKTKKKLKKICKKYDNEPFIMIDVGAHNGDTAFAISPHFKNINIVCIEPSEEKCNFIDAISAKNNIDNIFTFNYGVSNERGRGSLDKETPFDLIYSARHKVVKGTDFEIIKMDDIDYKYPIKIINLDVEGLEFEALQGAKNILINDEPEIILESKHSDINKIEGFLKNLGYKKSQWKTSRNYYFYKN
tara:strand:+ start:181 stop:906 length:726 start_codon:yes stop_codon:yes gene_type:complete